MGTKFCTFIGTGQIQLIRVPIHVKSNGAIILEPKHISTRLVSRTKNNFRQPQIHSYATPASVSDLSSAVSNMGEEMFETTEMLQYKQLDVVLIFIKVLIFYY
ncbi:hypothetical protein GOODEAATRI_011010 [Goodea atripinnis]|uniref:Uncharacterized protein n=1 Tax=Goodea atripinnis TaxID=208336 RepID=A0ABV0P3H3_9TELE